MYLQLSDKIKNDQAFSTAWAEEVYVCWSQASNFPVVPTYISSNLA